VEIDISHHPPLTLETHQFHDDLHGFLPECGTGTAYQEAKLAVQLAYRTGRLLYHIYLDFSKAYDSLDCLRAMGAVQNLPFQLDDGLCNLCNCLCESGLL